MITSLRGDVYTITAMTGAADTVAAHTVAAAITGTVDAVAAAMVVADAAINVAAGAASAVGTATTTVLLTCSFSQKVERGKNEEKKRTTLTHSCSGAFSKFVCAAPAVTCFLGEGRSRGGGGFRGYTVLPNVQQLLGLRFTHYYVP